MIPSLNVVLPIAGAAAVGASWIYFRLNNEQETASLFAGFVFAGIAIPTFIAALSASELPRQFRTQLTTTIVFAVFAGSVVSELSISYDEASFRREALKEHSTQPYVRPRAWPHQGARLAYVPSMGFSGSDQE